VIDSPGDLDDQESAVSAPQPFPDSAIGSQASNLIDGFLRSPLLGIAHWILMAIRAGPGRFG